MGENENVVPFNYIPQIHTGSFLTKEQAEQLRDTFKNLTIVVWCKDCKHYEQDGWCNSLGIDTNGPDWFCADGVRR